VPLLAEIPYPRIDPVVVEIGDLAVRWYGVSYVLSFVAAFFVLRALAKRGRWPVAPERVADVLFWGILGVFVGGRVGWLLFYAIPSGTFSFERVVRVWEGGMSFHGGLLGVILAYWIYSARAHAPRGDLFDGLALATTPGLLLVRLANFVNAELPGRVWDGPWAMRFPEYEKVGGPQKWEALDARLRPFTQPRHPSQLYEALAEGLLLFLVLRWLMLGRGWRGGRVAGAMLVGYGAIRFLIEFVREPDVGLGFVLGFLTQGQLLCLGMIAAGVVLLWRTRPSARGDAPP
jgi:phosphatidylglycerol:prolipoprotein diacylglycerol transferase